MPFRESNFERVDHKDKGYRYPARFSQFYGRPLWRDHRLGPDRFKQHERLAKSLDSRILQVHILMIRSAPSQAGPTVS